MRKGARLLLFAGKRLTGALTSPKVSVPDQNGRAPDCSPLSSSMFCFTFVARLGSAFLLSQRPQALLENAVEFGNFALRFHRMKPRSFTSGLLLDELHYAFAVFILVVLRVELIFLQ